MLLAWLFHTANNTFAAIFSLGDPARQWWLGAAVFWVVALILVAFGLFFLSLGNQFLHIGTSYNYTLDLAQIRWPATQSEDWSYLLRAVFPNAANWPLLIVPLAVVAGAAIVVRSRVLRR